jgi:hypothetical protein
VCVCVCMCVCVRTVFYHKPEGHRLKFFISLKTLIIYCVVSSYVFTQGAKHPILAAAFKSAYCPFQ